MASVWNVGNITSTRMTQESMRDNSLLGEWRYMDLWWIQAMVLQITRPRTHDYATMGDITENWTRPTPSHFGYIQDKMSTNQTSVLAFSYHVALAGRLFRSQILSLSL